MKNSKLLKFSILGLLPVVMAVGVISQRAGTPTKVDAYDITSLPTTIYLNDCTDDEIRNYYKDLNGKSDAELKGTNLLKNLKPILSKNQKYYSYYNSTGKNRIWQAYEIVDRDWEKSPATNAATLDGTYDSVENKITEYNYHNTSTTYDNPKNPYIRALYVDRDFDNPMKAWSLCDPNKTGDNTVGDNPNGHFAHAQAWGGFNQEHIWAKSHGFDDKNNTSTNSGGAQGDLMHLWPGDGVTNGSIHNNYDYGYVLRNGKEVYTTFAPGEENYASKNVRGVSKTLGSGTVFEPQDSDKGDIARAMFYMAARYNYYSETGTIDVNEPNLRLVDAIDSKTTGTSSAMTPYFHGVLSDLLEWNKLDPVDDYEIHRNNLLFKNFTNNRNPFIDFPEWVDAIWGTGPKANPSTDEINKGKKESQGEQEDTPSGMSKLNTISVGDKVTFVSEAANVEMVLPESSGGNFKGEEYTASVQGIVKFEVVEGCDENTFAFKNGTKYLSCSTVNSLSLSDTINKYSSWDVSFGGGNANVLNHHDNTWKLQYNNNNTNKFATYTSTQKPIQLYKQNDIPVTAISLNASSGSVYVGESLVLKATVSPKTATNKNVIWESNDENVATVENGVITGLSVGQSTITATAEGTDIKATFTVSVVAAPTLTGLQISGNYQKIFNLNEEYNREDLVVTATYDSISDEDVTSLASFSDVDLSTPGKKTITVSYKNKTTSYDIYVPDTIFKFDETVYSEDIMLEKKISNNGIDFIINSGGTSPKYWVNGNAARFYCNNSLTIQADRKIVNITFGFGVSDGTPVISFDSGSFDGNSWVGSSKKVNISITGENGNRRIRYIYVTTEPNPAIDYITADGLIKNTYEVGDQVDLTGLTVTAYFNNGTSAVLDSSEYTVTGFDSSTTGNKNLTITYKDSYNTEKTTTVAYKVSAASLTGIALSGSYKKTFEYGNELDTTGLVVTASYSNGTSENVTALVTFSGYSATTLGEQTITVSYTEGATKTATYKVTVVDYLDYIEVTGNKKTDYKYGDSFSKENIVVIAHMKSGATKDVTNSAQFSGYNGTSLSTQEITVKYTEGDHTAIAKYNVTVTDKLNSISLSGTYKTEYKYGEQFSSQGIVVTANMASGSKNVTANAQFSGYSPTTLGEQTITVSYTFDGVTKQATFEVNVKNFEKSIVLSGNYKTSYKYGEELDTNNLIVTATMADGSTQQVALNKCTISGYSKTTLGQQTITVKYGELKATYKVNVVDYVASLSLSGDYYLEYEIDTAYEPTEDGLIVTANYASGATKILSESEYEFTELDTSTAGKKTITISYQGVSTSYDVNVVEPTTEIDISELLGGCFGSVSASSLIVLTSLILGLGLVLLKKKEN